MGRLEKRHATTREKTRRNIFLIFVLGIAVGIGIASTRHMWEKKRVVTDTRNAVREGYDELSDRYENIELDIDLLQGDRDIERTIRERFRAIKDGEELVIFVDEESETGGEEVSEDEE